VRAPPYGQSFPDRRQKIARIAQTAIEFSPMQEGQTTAFAANAAVIDLHAFILVYSIHASRQLFPGFGTHALNVLGEDGLKIELEQSECTMCDPSGAAAAHRIVPVD
jgi:hypothetical protein